jgi:hypothetical protein
MIVNVVIAPDPIYFGVGLRSRLNGFKRRLPSTNEGMSMFMLAVPTPPALAWTSSQVSHIAHVLIPFKYLSQEMGQCRVGKPDR